MKRKICVYIVWTTKCQCLVLQLKITCTVLTTRTLLSCLEILFPFFFFCFKIQKLAKISINKKYVIFEMQPALNHSPNSPPYLEWCQFIYSSLQLIPTSGHHTGHSVKEGIGKLFKPRPFSWLPFSLTCKQSSFWWETITTGVLGRWGNRRGVRAPQRTQNRKPVTAVGRSNNWVPIYKLMQSFKLK